MAIFAGETSYFGLDIGTTSVRLVQLKKGGQKPYLVTYGSLPLPPNLAQSDATVGVGQLAASVKQLAEEANVSTKNVVAGLPTAKVFATVITMPKISDDELGKAIEFQAEQYIPMAVDQVKLDYTVVGQSADGKQIEVLLVACPNSVAARYVDILRQAGLDLVALELNATAVTRSLLAPDETAAVLDIGGLNSDLTLVHQGFPKLLRSIPVGGINMTKAASKSLGVNEEQAQQFMSKFGVDPAKMDGHVVKALKGSLDTLTGEVKKSIEFFSSHYPDVKFSKLVVTGASSNMPGLAQHLAAQSTLGVVVGDPWQNVAYPVSEQEKLVETTDQYAVAAGLAERLLV